jgi:lactoylglutathione lyase
MKLVSERHFPDAKFSLYFLVTVPEGQTAPSDPASPEGSNYIHEGKYGVTLELTHNHGTESDPNFSYHNGRKAPSAHGWFNREV